MRSLRERVTLWAEEVFPWSWRLAVLALPWQTRWYSEGPSIAGYPWEQGRVSIYASQVLILVSIALGFWTERARVAKESSRGSMTWRSLLVPGLLSLFFFTTRSFRATGEWVLEVSLLVGFFWTLKRSVRRSEFVLWVITSLIPHALLAILQTLDQHVMGSSFFGMASQDVALKGVSVIESNGIRWLRSYGGFSHPNILGGWMAIGLCFIVERFAYGLTSFKRRIFYYISLILSSIALILSYSRSAWLAGAIGIALSLVFIHRLPSSDQAQKRRVSCVAVLILLACIGTIATRPALVRTRTQTSARLEQKSLSERAAGVDNVFRIVRAYPWMGSGLGASSQVIADLDRAESRPSVIPIPPHAVPLLAFAELGLGGSMMLLFVFTLFVFRRRRALQVFFQRKAFFLPPVFALFPIFFLDHYLWSYWSGKVLSFVAISFVLLDEK